MRRRGAGQLSGGRATGSARGGGAVSPMPGATAPLPLSHPAALAAACVAAVCAAASVSYRLYEGDFWHHLLVGKAIWQTHAVPTTQLWSWPTYGAPEANSAWLFRAVIWPFWSLGGIWGLFLWRWLSTIATFALLWAAARRMGARGLSPLVALVLGVLGYSQRSDIRPETLVAVLLALEIWLLETRRTAAATVGERTRSKDPGLWLVALACVWANTHVSFPIFFLVFGAHLAAAHLPVPRTKEARARLRRLWGIAALSGAALFVNPFGWRAIWQPFEYALALRHEEMYRLIAELRPVDWSLSWRSGLPILVAGWPLLLMWRVRRRGLDPAEALLCAAFTALALSTQRFIGFYAIAATPYVARDLNAWLTTLPWPRWARPARARAGLTAVACVLIGIPEWSWERVPLGVGIEMSNFPVRACDFIATHGVHGRGFNHMHQGAYITWRFWPDPTRLPFITGTPEAASAEQRRLYVRAFSGREGWRAIDARYRFDFAVLDQRQDPADSLLDVLDEDPAWAAVFMDDAGALFVRRSGALGPVADSFAYREVPAGRALRESRVAAWLADPARQARALAELGRQVEQSPYNAMAHRQLADVAGLQGRLPEARFQLERALAVDPRALKAHLMLAGIALEEGRPDDALRDLERERVHYPDRPGLDRWFGRVYQSLGDLGRARSSYRRALARDPGDSGARDSLAAVERAMGRAR